MSRRLERHVIQGRFCFALVNAIRKNSGCKRLSVADRVLSRRSIREDCREIWNVSDLPTVHFLLDLDEKPHEGSLPSSGRRPPPVRGGFRVRLKAPEARGALNALYSVP